MRKLMNLKCVVVLLMVLTFQGVSQAQEPKVGGMNIENDIQAQNKEGGSVDVTVLFTLFKDGTVVRSTELSAGGHGTYFTEWKNLPEGPYEMHCEAIGFGKLIRKVAVGAGEVAPFRLGTLPEKETVQGAGPTLFELQRKIALLEKANAELQARLEAVEKAK